MGLPMAREAIPTGEEQAPFALEWWRRIQQHRWLIGGTTLVGVAAMVVFISLVTPRYTADAVLNVDPRRTQWTSLPTPVSAPPDQHDMLMAMTSSEVARLRSWTMALKVADALHLATDPEFKSKPSLTREAVVWWHENIELPIARLYGKKPRIPSNAGDLNKAQIDLAQAVEKGLFVEIDKATGLIHLSYTATDPEKAARITQEWLKLYIDDQVARKHQAIEEAVNWMDRHLHELQSRVDASDAAVQAYKANMQLMPLTQGATLAEHQAADTGMQLSQAEGELGGIDARIDALRAAKRDPKLLQQSPDAMQSIVVQNLRVSYGQALATMKELQSSFGPKHPRIIAQKAILGGIESSITTELNRLMGALQTEREAASGKVAAIKARMVNAKTELQTQTHAEGKLHQLEADAASNREIFNAFRSHRRELLTQIDMQQPDSAVLQPPSVPEKPSFPHRGLFLLAAIIASFMLGCGVALLRDRAAKGFRNLDELEHWLNVPAIGVLPSIAPPQRGTKGEMGTNTFLEMLRDVRTTLTNKGASQTVLMTSALPHEGKSVTALAMTRLAAFSGERVLLIDCDLARPSIHMALGYDNDCGLGDVIEGRAGLDEAIIFDPVSGASVLLSGRFDGHPTTLLASRRLPHLLETMKARYDTIYIDSAPLLAVADTTLLGRYVDEVLFLVRWRKTSRKAAQMAIRRLRDSTISTVLTRVNIRRYARYDSAELQQCIGYHRSYVKRGEDAA